MAASSVVPVESLKIKYIDIQFQFQTLMFLAKIIKIRLPCTVCIPPAMPSLAAHCTFVACMIQ